jgi:hypothetical protein
MALKLYRRHPKECEAGHPEDLKTGEFEDGRRGWKRCGCPINASGNIRGKFKRQSTSRPACGTGMRRNPSQPTGRARAHGTSGLRWHRSPAKSPLNQQYRRSGKQLRHSFPDAKRGASEGRRWRSTEPSSISSTRTGPTAATSVWTSSRSSIWTAFTPPERTGFAREPRSSNG